MGLVNAAVLSAYTAVPNPQAQLYEDPTREAWRNLGRAAIIEFEIDEKFKRFEKKYIPKYVVENGAWILTVGTIVTEQRFTYTWTF